MAERFDELRARLRRESAESDEALRQFVREGLTEERLREDWDRLRGADRLRGGNEGSRINLWRELMAALWMAHIPQRAAMVASVAVVLLAGWLIVLPGTIRLHTPGEWQVAGVILPKDMRINPRSGRVELPGPVIQLAANLGSGRRGSVEELSVYDVRFEWQAGNGEKIVFSGTMVVTNAPGFGTNLSKRNVRGALLTGDLTVGDQPAKPFSQPFIP